MFYYRFWLNDIVEYLARVTLSAIGWYQKGPCVNYDYTISSRTNKKPAKRTFWSEVAGYGRGGGGDGKVGTGCAAEYMHVKDNRQFCGQNTLWRSPDRPFFPNLETTSFLIYENRSHKLRPNKVVDRTKRCLGQNANFAGDFPHPGPIETLQGEYPFSHLLSLHFARA